MIRLNLLGEEIDRSGLYILQLIGALGVIALALAGCFLFQSDKANELAELEDRKSQLEARLRKLRSETKEAETLEIKKQLLADKLTTIATLKANKYGPVRMMDDINVAIPERAWLLELAEKDNAVDIKGVALDNQTVSIFMDQLEKSVYLKDVDLGESTEYVKDEVNLRNFSISATLVNSLEVNNLKNEEDPDDENLDAEEE